RRKGPLMSSDLAVKSPSPSAFTATDTTTVPIWRSAFRWESGLVIVLIITIIFGASASSNFLNSTTVFFLGLNVGEIAIMALPLTLIIMTGEIDLSVASMLGLSGTVLGYLFEH